MGDSVKQMRGNRRHNQGTASTVPNRTSRHTAPGEAGKLLGSKPPASPQGRHAPCKAQVDSASSHRESVSPALALLPRAAVKLDGGRKQVRLPGTGPHQGAPRSPAFCLVGGVGVGGWSQRAPGLVNRGGRDGLHGAAGAHGRESSTGRSSGGVPESLTKLTAACRERYPKSWQRAATEQLCAKTKP